MQVVFYLGEGADTKVHGMARLTREESRERTRERLLEAARVEIARNGYDGTSVADIAEAAGYSKGAIFSNFESKEALVLELLRRHKEQDIETLGRILGSGTQSRDAIGLDRYLEDLGETGWVRLDIELQLHAARNPTFAANYHALQSQTRSSLADLLAALFEKAGKRPPAPLNELADLFLALVHGLVLQRARDPGTAVKLVFESLMATADPV